MLVAPDVQRASGIEVAPMTLSIVQAEQIAYAMVIDLQPLFDLSNRLASARATVDSAQIQAESSRRQWERTQPLYNRDHLISLQAFQDARAALQTDQAKLQAEVIAHSSLQASLRQQFGDVLANAAATPASGLFKSLASGDAVVVRVTLPTKSKLEIPTQVAIDTPDSQGVSAHKLSRAPQIDPAIQGATYFYRVDNSLAAGTRIKVHWPSDDKTTSGVLIPESAIIWYGGQPWVYVRTAADSFTRRSVNAVANTATMNTTAIHAGEEVVIRGAQLLLSEEQRPVGITTQCADPPECDD